MLAVIAVPVVFGYAAVRYGARFLSAVRRGEAASFWQNEKRRLSFIGGVNLLFALLLAYGWLIEAKWVERVDAAIDLDVPGPIRIVHLSDLHAESFGERERRALDIVRSAEPDIIVLTGDYTSKRTGLAGTEHARRFVSELDAPSGIFAVPGNWDSSLGPLFEGTEVELLEGRSTRVPVRDLDVFIAGTWFDAPPPPADTSADLAVYLQHSPDFLAEASRAGYDLYLAGHTHGGQVRIPGFGAVITLSRFWKRYESGLYRDGDTYLYVNRGLGLEGGWAPRVRLFCRPEVTVLELRPRTTAR